RTLISSQCRRPQHRHGNLRSDQRGQPARAAFLSPLKFPFRPQLVGLDVTLIQEYTVHHVTCSGRKGPSSGCLLCSDAAWSGLSYEVPRGPMNGPGSKTDGSPHLESSLPPPAARSNLGGLLGQEWDFWFIRLALFGSSV